MSETLAVIPARGGSKGVPRKNIARLAGKPLLAWTIEAARRSAGVGRIVVSTDDLEIADTAREWGAEVPFLRPAALARDDTPGIAPLIHAVRWLEENEGYAPDWVLLLQPTSPFRTTEDIDAALELMERERAEATVSLTEAMPPQWLKRIEADGRLQSYLPGMSSNVRRQDTSPAYNVNGAIYLVRRDILLERETFYTERTFAYVMPPERSLDVDTTWDFHLAELVWKERVGHGAS